MPAKQTNINPHIQWFRDAAPYINAHRDCTFVINLCGEAIADANFAALINDIALLNSLGVKLVLVHGARPQIESRLKKHKIKSRYAEGLRITDDAALPLVKEAIASVRLEIEAQLSCSLINTPMSGSKIHVSSGNFVFAKPYGVRNGIDFMHTGEIRKVDHSAIQAQLNIGNVVLLSSLGFSPTGEIFNLRAEDVATEIATALNAEKLIFMMEGPGLSDTKKQPIKELSIGQAETLLSRRKTLPEIIKQDLAIAINACNRGVKRVHLLSRTQDGSLLQELYTRDGIGTLVTAEAYENLRPANINDVGGIIELITPLETEGILVKRSREQLELDIKHFLVTERDGMIIACAALYPYIEAQAGEIACVVVHARYSKQQRGAELLAMLEKRARQLGLNKLFVLSTHTVHWFKEQGYKTVDPKQLPMQKQRLYNYRRNSKVLMKPI